MRLKGLTRHWDTFGKRDPLWAALTDRRRSPEEFFRSGEDELGAVLDRARALGITVDLARALDFGCGVGRLTQAMAQHFRRSDGVDIAPSMIAAARRHNRFTGTCQYHLNTSGDLNLFESRSFTFIYSVLVLQHMEPEHAKAYLRDFLRLLAPGGLLVFQLPSRRAPNEPPPGSLRTRCNHPLPRSAFQAAVRTTDSEMTLLAGKPLTLRVTVRNEGDQLWPSLGRPGARFQIHVARRWLQQDGAPVKADDARCPLPYDLAPEAEATVLLEVTPPSTNGDYLLELDLVQEDVGWFGEMGSASARVRVRVEGGEAARDDRLRPPPGTPARMRHPWLFRLFRATGLRSSYWTFRRVIDAIKWKRDVCLPPLRRLRSQWRPRMEMHCVPRDEVITLVRDCGGAVIEMETELVPGGFQSDRYWVRLARP